MIGSRKIYIKAAKLIHSGDSGFSCSAVDKAVFVLTGHGQSYSIERELYARTMSPFEERQIIISDISRLCGYDGDREKELRVWLLCMMAAACKDFQ